MRAQKWESLVERHSISSEARALGMIGILLGLDYYMQDDGGA